MAAICSLQRFLRLRWIAHEKSTKKPNLAVPDGNHLLLFMTSATVTIDYVITFRYTELQMAAVRQRIEVSFGRHFLLETS